MGNLLSSTAAAVRRSNTEDSDAYRGGSSGGGGAYRYPPKNGRPYFASHFIMGGEKFDSPTPESFLFGENCDLNYLGSKPVSFPYPPPAANEPTKTLKSHINIRRDSLHLSLIHEAADDEDAGNATDGGGEGTDNADDSAEGQKATAAAAAEKKKKAAKDRKYNVTFTLDSDVRCAITVHYFCNEEISASGGVTFHSTRKDLCSETYEYRRGAAQVFDHPEHVFQSSRCESELAASSTAEEVNGHPPDLIAIAVHCVSLEGDAPRQSHTTIGAFTRYSDGSYSLKAHKQKLFVDGLSYLLQEIYGLENKVTEPLNKPYSDVDDDVDDCGAECVVCMVDLRDTIILPCRHLCLCYACADSLRYQANNCPICRAPFRALLQIRAVQKIGQVTHPALPVEQDAGEMPVPPGYQCVSLIEALNGPISNPNPAPAAPPVAVALQSSSEKKNRKRSSKSRQQSSSSSRQAGTSTSSSGPPTSAGSNAAPPGSSASTVVPVVPEEAESMIDEEGAGNSNSTPNVVEEVFSKSRALSSSSRSVSVKYVNELGDGVSGSNASLRSVTTINTAKDDAAADDGDDDDKEEESYGTPLVTSMDLVEEELANMSVSDVVTTSSSSAVPTAMTSLISSADKSSRTKVASAAVVVDEDEETVVVNLTSGATTRVSLPGTPTSIVSARSSQDSSSSSSSTKQLLPQQLQTSVTAAAAAPRSAGSAVIVRVHPTKTTAAEAPLSDERAGGGDNEEDC